MNQPEQEGVQQQPSASDSQDAGVPASEQAATANPIKNEAVAGEASLEQAASASAPANAETADSAGSRKPGPLAARKPGTPGSPAAAPSSAPSVSKAPAQPKKTIPKPQNRPGSAPPAFERNRQGVDGPDEAAAEESTADDGKGEKSKRNRDDKKRDKPKNKQIVPPPKPKVAVPSKRGPLGDDLEAELERELAGSGIEDMLGGSAGMPERESLQDGQRLQATVIKKNPDSVFVSLGGPDEGVVPFVQFETEPEIGAIVEVVVRGFNGEDGLYVVTLPGQAVEASDWDDLEEGNVVEAFVSGTCNGGAEAKVGSLKAFIPISQLSEFRVEDASDFVDKKLMCVVTEVNPKRKNLVLSHRAVLEREREERRAEQMAKIEVGDELEGTVRKVLDFGAFVDLGGVEGLIHVSKLSWDRIKHPNEVIEEGQKVKVKIEKIDPNSGKIGLSYRDLLDHPWDDIDAKYPLNSTVRGVVTKVADFGAFVRLAVGIEGLIHISELAHHRVVRVTNIVNVGDEIEVKVLSVDRESQRMGLSLKGTQPAPESEKSKAEQEEELPDLPRPDPVIKPQHTGPLKGGTDGERGGAQFGLKW